MVLEQNTECIRSVCFCLPRQWWSLIQIHGLLHRVKNYALRPTHGHKLRYALKQRKEKKKMGQLENGNQRKWEPQLSRYTWAHQLRGTQKRFKFSAGTVNLRNVCVNLVPRSTMWKFAASQYKFLYGFLTRHMLLSGFWSLMRTCYLWTEKNQLDGRLRRKNTALEGHLNLFVAFEWFLMQK